MNLTEQMDKQAVITDSFYDDFFVHQSPSAVPLDQSLLSHRVNSVSEIRPFSWRNRTVQPSRQRTQFQMVHKHIHLF